MTSTPPEPAEPSGVPQPDLDPPLSMVLAVRLMWAGAVVSVLSVIASLATYGSFTIRMAQQMREADPQISDDLVDTAIAVGITFAVAMGVLGAAVWVWMAVKNRQGRAWARIVASVLSGLNAVFFAVGLAGEQYDSLSLLVSATQLFLAAAVLALLWRKESTAFYDAVSRRHTL
ncbi:MAG: hypothetical protein WB508_00380 [Aeromicrobium sp.]|uniref:hypothetical protein n=1 Tax=Aeromicrobium sp. TaxID=1871063 RepID=UPI003C508C04